MGCNTHKRNAEEPFRNDFRDFHGVKLLSFPFRQDLVDCPAQGSQLLATKGDCPDLAGQIEEVPLRFLDFLAKSVPIEILYNSPARQENFTLDRQACWQKRVLSDEDGSRCVVGWHLYSPYPHDVRAAARKAFCRSRNLRAASGVRHQLLRLALCKSFPDSRKSPHRMRNPPATAPPMPNTMSINGP